jgi:probable F420-dependent oxidoreductase
MSNGSASLATVGKLGIWSLELRGRDSAAVRDAAAELDSQGWGALWIAGATGPGIWSDAERLLSSAPNAAVALGVMSIWNPDASVAPEEHERLTDTYGRRLLSGFGVSGAPTAAAVGQPFSTPLKEMNRYFDELDATAPVIPEADRIVGALGPRMVALSARRAGGIHPFLVTPESNVTNRELVGPDTLIAPHQAVVLETNSEKARAIARRGIGMFIGFPSYQANLRRLGFGDDDLIPGGSDRLIDATVAWGTLEQVDARLREHWDAGADHVAVHVLTEHRSLPTREWRELAALLPASSEQAAHAL